MDVPLLEGWVTFSEVARRLGISPQAVHLMHKGERFRTVRRIGEARTVAYLIREEEAAELVQVQLVMYGGPRERKDAAA